ncbi:phage baseplate upper protein [Melissococcus plutonius]|uniref:phage baseplate upper protein n=1 Tax=Melissococcus plutonius TaxID=33970 RepID=UPI003C2DA3EF
MTEYPMTLSTTEPNNFVGLIKIRQGDTESQVFDVSLVQNGVPVDFTGLTPFFCVKSSPFTGLGCSEQKVTQILDEKRGHLKYTLTDYDMQAVQLNHAYFSFRKLAKDLTWRQQFSTKDFAYSVVPSIYTDGIKDSNYIWTFEEILRYFQEWVKESMKTYDDWYLKAQAELKRIIKLFSDWMNESKKEYETWRESEKEAFDQWMITNKQDYEAWFKSVKEILESIDPNGKLLSEIIDARQSIDGKRHTNLKERLDTMENSSFTITDREVDTLMVLQDDHFSKNHSLEIIETSTDLINTGTLVIAEIDNKKQDTFYLEKVGEING